MPSITFDDTLDVMKYGILEGGLIHGNIKEPSAISSLGFSHIGTALQAFVLNPSSVWRAYDFQAQ